MKSFIQIICRTVILLLLARNLAYPQSQKLKFERISIEQGLSQSGITSIFQDSRGLMWFGTNAGLNKYDGYGFMVYKHDPNDPNSLSGSEVGVIVEDARCALWIATWGGGLNRFDPETEKFTHWKHDPDDPNSLSDDYITDLHLDSCHGGVFWIATEYGGLNRFDPETGKFTRWMPKWIIAREAFLAKTDPTDNVEKNIMPIHEDASGDLWMGIGSGGLNRFNRETETFDRWVPEPENPRSISFEYVEFICKDPRGDRGILWVATHGGGLNRFDIETETFTHWRNDPGDPNSLSDDEITNIYEDKSGVIWVGTYGGGLNRFDPKTGEFQHWISTPKDTIGSGMDIF